MHNYGKGGMMSLRQVFLFGIGGAMKTSRQIFKFIALGIALICLFLCAVSVLTACNEEPQKEGEFYTLQEAYDAGLLATDDLKNIAYYLNGEERNNDFMPSPKEPAELSVETKQAIKETRAYDLRHEYSEDGATAEDVNIIHYYGTYNGCIALMYTDKYSNYDSAIWDVEIAGVTFRYYSGNRICIWQPL